MKDIVYIVFNKKGIVKTLKTRPSNEHYIKVNLVVEEQYFAKHQLETTLKIDKNTEISLEEFQIEINKIKKGL